VSVDLDAVHPLGMAAVDPAAAAVQHARLATVGDVPRRPVRILLGVWRN